MSQHRFELFADYHQFYLQDEAASGDLSNSWGGDAEERLLALAPGCVGVGTARNTFVPVVVETLASEPARAIDGWDQVNECSLRVDSGRLVVAGCTDYFPDAARIDLAPADYRVRVSYANLGSVSADGLDGADHYLVQLWPAPPGPVCVVKPRRA